MEAELKALAERIVRDYSADWRPGMATVWDIFAAAAKGAGHTLTRDEADAYVDQAMEDVSLTL